MSAALQTIDGLIRLLDAANLLPANTNVAICADRLRDAEYAFRLWAGGHCFDVRDDRHHTADGLVQRTLGIVRPDGSEVAHLEWEPEDDPGFAYQIMADREDLLALDELAAAHALHDEQLRADAWQPEHEQLGVGASDWSRP